MGGRRRLQLAALLGAAAAVALLGGWWKAQERGGAVREAPARAAWPPRGDAPLAVFVYDNMADLGEELLARCPETYRRWYLATDAAAHRRALEHAWRTDDPERADLFYVPYLSSAHALWSLSRAGDAPDAAGVWRSVLERLEKGKYARHWRRRGGRDHLWVFSLDYGACVSTHRGRAAETPPPPAVRRGVVASTLGDLHAPACFAPGADIVVPPTVRAGFVARAAALRGGVPSARRVRIEPRATTLFDEAPGTRRALEAWSPAAAREWAGSAAAARRSRLVWWRGKEASVRDVRARLVAALEGDPRSGHAPGDSERRPSPSMHQDGMMDAHFCLCPAGQAPWSPRLVESVLAGCIPVVVSDDIVLPLDARDGVDWDAIAVRVPEARVDDVVSLLAAVPDARRREMRIAGAEAAPRLVLLPQRLPGAWGDRDAFDGVLEAARRRLVEWYGPGGGGKPL